MKFFETLWDVLGLARAPAQAKPAQAKPAQAKPAQAKPAKATQAAGKRPRSKHKSIPQNSQPAAQPALQQTASQPATRPCKADLVRLMHEPARDGQTPDVPERLPASLRERYDLLGRTHLEYYGVRVRKWRSSSSGVAWCVAYRDGRIQRLIESPRPTTPLSCAIFLHEIGHHAIGLGVYSPRCLEEYHAWAYAVRQMEAWGVEVSPRVQQRMARSLKYAADKARRRGIKSLPPELLPYV